MSEAQKRLEHAATQVMDLWSSQAILARNLFDVGRIVNQFKELEDALLETQIERYDEEALRTTARL